MRPWIGLALERLCDRIGRWKITRSERNAQDAQTWFQRAERWRNWRKEG